MKIDPENFRKHYASLSDEALLAIDRSELLDVAQRIYDEEVASRDLMLDELDDFGAIEDEPVIGMNVDENWLEHAASACSFAMRPHGDSEKRAGEAREVLTAAGIPSEIKYRKEEDDAGTRELCEVLVPGNLSMYASSILDKELFNSGPEEAWKLYFASLSDEELRTVNRELLFAGLVDLLERARKAYKDEVRQRVTPATS